MPHILVEYSANIEDEIGLDALFAKLTDVAVETGVFELKGIRVRGIRRDRYRISDNHPDNAFVHTVLRVGHGREIDRLKAAGDRIYAVVCDHLQAMYESRPLNISMEFQEIHPVLTFKKNNIQDHMSRRDAPDTPARPSQAAE